MSYIPKRRIRQTRKSIDVDPCSKLVKELPALRRKRILAYNRLVKTLDIAKLAEIDESQIDKFVAYFSECKRCAANFEEAHGGILSIVDPSQEEEVDELRSEFDEIYFEILAIHRRLTTNIENNRTLDCQTRNVNVKLPKINLPQFSGNIKLWPEYYDIFSSLIHENECLSDTERMHYLISSLSGDALALIRVFPATGKYYGEAYEALLARYKNKRELAFTCWKEMQAISLQSHNAHEFRRVLDTFHENLTILNRLDLPTEHWDFILCYLLLSKLDSVTRCEFEQEHPANELPTYGTLKDFLYAKCEALVRDTHFSNSTVNRQYKMQTATYSDTKTKYIKSTKKPSAAVFLSHNDRDTSPVAGSSTFSQRGYKCSFCNEDHSISQCKSFMQKSTQERINYAKSHHWCFNCLKSSHALRDCKSIFSCRKCSQRHHSLLHQEDTANPVSEPQYSHLEGPISSRESPRILTSLDDRSVVLLSTAKIQVKDSNGHFQTLRAVIDSGSQSHFITEKAVNLLGLRQSSSRRKINGLGQASSFVSGVVNLDIGACGKSLFKIAALTLPTICGKMPSRKLSITSLNHVQQLALADPECHLPGRIDVLLGAEIFSSLLVPGIIKGGPKKPSALNSVFGWLLMGNAEYKQIHNYEINSLFVSNHTRACKSGVILNEDVEKFWELENVPFCTRLTPDEEICERKYVTEHSRNETGRYIIKLPFKTEYNEFPGSRDLALKRFYSLERKLANDLTLRQQYHEFMRDYIRSGHMSKVPIDDLSKGKYYIPHHCIVRPDSSTTKLRVVFDASAKAENNTSLNEALLVGPKLQANIVALLLRFRIHAIVFTADVRQMYRQILCDETDRDFQRIFWRYKSSEPINEYRLNTVTYGVSAAPYLAIRTIKQLIEDHGEEYAMAATVLNRDVYVDDVVTGCDTLEHAVKTKIQLIELLLKGHFQLRKWTSNAPELLADLAPEERLLTDGVSLDIETSPSFKVLGLKWNPVSDKFMFNVQTLIRKCSKRTILSELARIFDPLGFLTPLTFLAKCYIQKLWLLEIGWDDTPPVEIVNQWERYCDQLPLIKTLEIPRHLPVNKRQSYQFHGFADSSEVGYGAVIYLRTIDSDDHIEVFFICAKSRVAPVKKLSLPRLELCAAVLLSNLMKFVIETYSQLISISNIFAWSDSTVVLAWLKSPSSRWKTFVANRVSHVQDTLPDAQWNHVSTETNPADIASRGLLPGELVDNHLWWAGPTWLTQPSKNWLPNPDFNETAAKIEERLTLLVQTDPPLLDELIERFASIRKSQRIMAYCLRFINHSRKSFTYSSPWFSRRELYEALLVFVKRCQTVYFREIIARLQQGQSLPKQMRKLNPFVDKHGILRVGGRLSQAGLEFEHKHPALLPRDSKLTYLIIDAIHNENCHPGINTVQYLITQQFWILSAKRAVRHCLSKCIKCFRANPVPLQPYMGDLPAARVNQVKPFSIVGVDYAGPFRIKLGNHRNAKIGKAYLCLFVCFTTKAVHLELASDMSSEAYLAALRRFVGRRGRVKLIHSDNGSNFVGASNHLHTYMQRASEAEQIEFRFNPPSSPHFGGIWEIQVKAVKSHLYRIIGDQALTFEELNTVFVQIEAMLNSRPLCPLSSDPNDFNVLTPGHFLTLEPLTAIPDADLTDTKLYRLGRWQLIQRFQQIFWKRWKVEYLQSLTQRAKWTKHCKPLTVGSIVIIKKENTIPLHWPIARVVELHPGPDGVVRVVTVRTPSGSHFRRSVVTICPLPTNSD